MLSDEPEASCRDHRPGRLRRPRSQISDLGAGTVSRRELAEATEKVRALKAAARLPGGGARRVRGTGMMAGGDGTRAVAGGPARHIPVLGRPAVELLNVRDGGVYIDGTFGAGGYTRAILAAADCQVIGIDRDQQRDGARRRTRRAGARPADAGRGALLATRRGRARRRLRARSTASCSISACPRCSSTGRARLLVPARRAARHAHGRRGRRAPPTSSPRRASAISPTSSSCSARSAIRARSRAPSSRRATKRRSPPPRALADIVGRGGACAAGRHPSGDAHVPGAAHFRQRRAGRACRGARRRRARAQARRPAGRGLVPFARRPHRQDVLRRAQRDRRRLAPSAGSQARRRRPSALLTKRPHGRRRRRDRAQPARPLGQAARRRAHATRRRARTTPRCCRGCRRSPTCCGGAEPCAFSTSASSPRWSWRRR